MGLATTVGKVILWPFKVVSRILCTSVLYGGGALACAGCAVCMTGAVVACLPLCLCEDCEEIHKSIVRGQYSRAGTIY